MEILTFTLKQHTPMLHFQASQQGATLRATDVKPRFDRWLIEKVWKNDFDQCCSFLVGYSEKFSKKQMDDFRKKFNTGYRALNYKMRIIAGNNGRIIPFSQIKGTRDDGRPIYQQNAPMYFGDKSGEKHNLLDNDNLIKMEVAVPDAKLGEEIERHIGSFFMNNNFGTRASKGYGSFTVTDKELTQNKLFYTTKGTYLDVLNEVDKLYKTMRSGINFGGIYFKSLMFSYARSLGMRWDKKTIKETMLIDKEIDRQTVKWKKPDILTYKDRANDRFDFRDALGLSTSESWMFYGVGLSKNRGCENKSLIKRFSSPILFKPVCYDKEARQWRVYICWKELPQDIYSKDIVVSVHADKRNGANMKDKVDKKFHFATSKHPIDIVTLRIPPQFKMADYIDYIFKGVNGKYKVSIEQQFSEGCRNKPEAKNIRKIYVELRDNYNR